MQYGEAFKKLGYSIKMPRQDWSAEKSDGICISIWQKECSVFNGLPYCDLWELHPNGGAWEQKLGHSRRTRYLQRAINEFEGKVDVILVTGNPGESYESADPWIVSERGAGWYISKFDPATGFFRAEIDKRVRS